MQSSKPGAKRLPLAHYGDVVASFMARKGFQEATEVQCEVWREELRAKDIMAVAPTGSGKTLAYLLALVRDAAEVCWVVGRVRLRIGGRGPCAVAIRRSRCDRCKQRTASVTGWPLGTVL